jgi:predicted ATPase
MFELSVRTSKTAVPVSLADVGFGIGQLLPILVADLQLPRGGTLAISQPEIHLHPSVQADIAEYFVNRALSKRSRYIIETHSEYFLNRLRLLVAQGKLSPDDLSILYLSQDGTQIKSHKIKFNPDGRIEGAPKDFFQTYMLDVMNIAIEAKA